MKKIIHPILSLLFVLIIAFSANAQTIKLIAPTAEIKEGEEYFDIPIKVDSFINVSGMQFTLKWDADVLEFMYIDSANFVLDYMTFKDNFGLTDIDKGIMTFFWEDKSLQGQDLPDGSVIFTVKTKVIGSPGSETMIEFIEDPTAIELSDPDFNIFPVELVTGNITLEGSSSAAQRAIENARISITPNPFREKANVAFYLDKSAQTQIGIYDLEGKKIHEISDYLSSGKQSYQFDKGIFPAAGIYLLKIKTEDFQVSKKLFLVK